MNKAVLISIRPKWCDLIASGWKTIEVRKTCPKLKPPFKCYIYMTKQKKSEDGWLAAVEAERGCYYGAGSVIGEFVCDEIIKYDIDVDGGCLWGEAQDCLSGDEFEAYIENVNVIYGWHISGLVIYDKPKELREFFRFCGENPNCDGCGAYYYSSTECGTEEYCCSIMEGCKPLSRPPQSWCYVEELK